MPRLQIVMDRSELDAADGSVIINLNRNIHTKKVVLKGYSISCDGRVDNFNDAFLHVDLSWMTTGHYNLGSTANTGPTQGFKLPVTMRTTGSTGLTTIEFNVNLEFHVPGHYIPSSFPIRITDATGKRWGTDSFTTASVFMLYFEFEEQLTGI